MTTTTTTTTTLTTQDARLTTTTPAKPKRRRTLLRKVLIGLASIIVLFVGIVATRPAKYHVERSTLIQAPPDAVFREVNDLHAWTAWSPWEHSDPQMTSAYDGPTSGVGAIYSWSGDNKVGEGKMTIVKSDTPSQVQLRLDFERPMKSTSTATFTFMSMPDGSTRVTWSMDGENSFAGKAFSLFFNMDKLLGAEFDRGLAEMKSDVENVKSGKAQN